MRLYAHVPPGLLVVHVLPASMYAVAVDDTSMPPVRQALCG